MTYTITVTCPASGASVTWQSNNLKSVMNQARIEIDKGAKVRVTDDRGRVMCDR